MDHVIENLAIVEDALPNTLSIADLEVIDRAKQFYIEQTKVDCTLCLYCADCPAKVRISGIFQLYNDAFMYNEHDKSKGWYKRIAENKGDFSVCVDCGKCEEVCPQQLDVRNLLKEFHDAYSG